MKKFIFISIFLLAVSGISVYQIFFNSVKTITLSEKKVEWVETQISSSANRYFWDQFHQGNYDNIPVILKKLTAAYLDNPNDIRTITHLGFTHMWAISEHQNGSNPRAIEHATLAQKYFGESYRMNPRDTRVLSFLSSIKLANGAISNDDGLLKDGYLNGLKAIREWEEFSAFSLGYSLSRLPHTDQKYKEALKLMESIASSYAENFNPKSSATQQAISEMELLKNTDISKERVLKNSWVAPHNIEGVFMVYGDMLVKNGAWQEAIEIYKLARFSEQYDSWAFKEVLENRIVNAKANVEFFRKEIPGNQKPEIDKAMLIQTSISCRSCHQMSKTDKERFFTDFDESTLLTKEFYNLEP
jgi:tetratricopeptide (TPR) repeat protein